MSKFPEQKNFDLAQINKDVLQSWDTDKTFEKSLSTREGHPEFVFYEGPPSANGLPGIHHVISRTIKDIFCRYKTNKGFKVERQAGWDTHGLPVELGVEKKLGITKEAIGKTISVTDYNRECREEVMRYTDIWEDVTRKMGYWVDMPNAYITFKNQYIESLWWSLKELYKKNLLYKGYTIQPYSPAAGTGLSTHELNMPGCYKDVKDTTVVAQFEVKRNEKSEKLFAHGEEKVYILAWTTTPWTLLSNTALAVGKKIEYVKVLTLNPYTEKQTTVILAKALMGKYFNAEKNMEFSEYKKGGKNLPFKVLAQFTGEELEGMDYHQLMPYQQPTDGDAFRVVTGDFVSTEDGTGIVHIAPSFGADDFRTCKQNGIGSLTLVDKRGYFVEGVGEFSNRPVKNSYDPAIDENQESIDVEIAVKLKLEDKAFKIEKHEHSYPHCWRTDKPILYYPLDSWFIKTTAAKERMLELNNTINWKPKSTGEGRFGKWLENLVDWNLSRSRYWGTPLPIWRTDDASEEICIGSLEELKNEAQKAVDAGFMTSNPLANFVVGDFSDKNYNQIDLHRPFVDDIILVSPSGKPMKRELDLIDVWYDSGAVPFAQIHYPFENKERYDQIAFPSDFIAEGVDQTRGWFFTLHALGTMLFDSVAFKNIISTGLLLDKNGVKMSKRLGNVINPFDVIETYGSDPMRWYMITNAAPWENLKFDLEGVDEVRRKFFGTLYNTYSFFSLYANVDGWNFSENEIPVNERPEIDRWIISLLNSLVKEAENAYENYEPTRAGRAIQNFVGENLSNWYVRLNRKRFWGGEINKDKQAAYQTLYTCLLTVAKLAAPIAPFYTDVLFSDLNKTTGKETIQSVHLTLFPKVDETLINAELEERMALAQKISSMTLGLRRKENLKVRQPLQKIMIPVLTQELEQNIESIKDIILTEINVKAIEYLNDAAGILVKKIKPNFKTLGKKYGKHMKAISAALSVFTQTDIAAIEREKQFSFESAGENVLLTLEDIEITSQDIPGWTVATEGNITVALDVTISEELKHEGIAREFINKIQNLRKDSGFEVTDKINLQIQKHEYVNVAVENFKEYIGSQTLASSIVLVDEVIGGKEELINEATVFIKVAKV